MEGEWERVEVSVERIANGFLVTNRKCRDYDSVAGDRLFYPTMESVERELVIRLRAAAALDMSTAKENF